jgi:hypothetical protein
MDPLEQRTTAPASVTDRLMGRLIDFETVADGSAANAGDQAGDDPSGTAQAAGAADAAQAAAAAAGGETESSAVATGAAPAWSPDDPRFLEAVDGRALDLIEQRFGPIAQLLEQTLSAGTAGPPQPGVQQGQQQLVPPDPFSDNYAAEFAAYQQARDEQMFGRFEQMIGQIAQPLNERIESETTAEGEQRLKDMLADDIARNGEFPRLPGQTTSKSEQLVRPLAQALFPQIAARYGAGPRAAEVAMSQAAQTVRELVNEAGQAALEAERNRTATLAGARTDIGSNGAAGAQLVGEIRARTMEEGLSAVTARHAAAIRGQ